VRVRVPAKINLVLAVGPLRPDGYHDLATVFHAVSLYDDVSAEAAAELSLDVDGPYGAGVPVNETNLAMRAARALAKHAGVPAAARLHVRKHIPVAGGMAGGSADAAGVLLTCNELWGLDLDHAQLAVVAATLGSDVPFALTGGTALGYGRGERLEPLEMAGPLHWVVAVASGGLSTPEVYRRLDALRAGLDVPEPAIAAGTVAALCSGDAESVAALLRNDLQAVAIDLYPALAATLSAGRALGAIGGLVSGSGPTCAFLARDAAHAAELADALAASGTCAAALAGTGPAGIG
jgi:4-diphosphocytidyl-2-C-methyl-D-erythritol kinase